MIIVGTDTPEYVAIRKGMISGGQYNGAYYYAKEIEKYFVPSIETDRDWVLLNVQGMCSDRAIVFIHNNMHPEYYDWLKEYKNLILVCGVPETCEKVKHLGRTIYLPLSVDVEEVEKYKAEKTKTRAYVGRIGKRVGVKLPHSIDFLEGLERKFLLQEMAKYRIIYAVGRTAIEGKILGCEVLPYDPRYPDPGLWQIYDSKKACKRLQIELNKIDKQ